MEEGGREKGREREKIWEGETQKKGRKSVGSKVYRKNKNQLRNFGPSFIFNARKT